MKSPRTNWSCCVTRPVTSRFTWLAGLLGTLCLAVAGCGEGDFPIAKVKGVVLCNGKPVANASIFFEPIQAAGSENPLVGKQAIAFSDAEGKFTLSTYGTDDGAVVGQHRVRVSGMGIKCDCSLNAERDVMQADVKSGQINEFTVELPPATSADRRRANQAVDE